MGNSHPGDENGAPKEKKGVSPEKQHGLPVPHGSSPSRVPRSVWEVLGPSHTSWRNRTTRSWVCEVHTACTWGFALFPGNPKCYIVPQLALLRVMGRERPRRAGSVF